MKILVTGATGFLGKFLCQALKNEGHFLVEVHSKNGNLLKEDALLPFNSIIFDQIYHLAAWTQAGDFCLHHSGEQWIINQKINTHLLSWWSAHQKQAKLICMGTSCAYDPALPLEEKYYFHGLPIDSLFTYAMTKRMLLAGLQALNKQYGLSYLYLVPSTLYGPDYHLDGRQMHFIFDLIRKVLLGATKGEPVVLWGDGEQKRELIHVKDFVTTLLHLSRTVDNEVINIGSGQEHSIKEFVAMICKQVGYCSEKIVYDETKYVGARSKVLSIEKLRRIYPSFSTTPLAEGLVETIDWFSQHFPLPVR